MAAAGFDGEGVGPLAFYCVEDVFLFACGVQDGGETVLFAGYPAFAAVVYLCYIAGGGGDVGTAIKFDERFAVDEAFDVEGGERDEVGFVVGGDGEKGVPDLLDVDCA